MAGAGDPRWYHARRFHMRPRSGDDGLVQHDRAADGRRRRPAVFLHRKDGVRYAWVAGRGADLPSLDRTIDPGGARHPLELDGRRLREESRLIHERRDAALHQVRAHVEEEEQAAEEEEGDDEQRRHEADEDVGERELAADAPEQAALGADVHAVADRNQADQKADAADDIDPFQGGGQRIRDGVRGGDDQLDARAGEQRAAGERAGEPPPRLVSARRRITRQGFHADTISEYSWTSGLSDIP